MNRRKLLGMLGAAPLTGAGVVGAEPADRLSSGPSKWFAGHYACGTRLYHLYFALPEIMGRQLTWFVTIHPWKGSIEEATRSVIWDDGTRTDHGRPQWHYRNFGEVFQYYEDKTTGPRHMVCLYPSAVWQDETGEGHFVWEPPHISGDDQGEITAAYVRELLMHDKIIRQEQALLLANQPPYDINDLMAAAKSQLGWPGPINRSQS